VAAGSVGFTSTVMVGFEEPELLLLFDGGVVATVPTDEMTPGVFWLLGRVMVTLSPTATSDCSDASSAMLTWRVVEVAWSTDWPGWAGPRAWLTPR